MLLAVSGDGDDGAGDALGVLSGVVMFSKATPLDLLRRFDASGLFLS